MMKHSVLKIKRDKKSFKMVKYSEKAACLLVGSLGIPVPTSPSYASDINVYIYVCVYLNFV